MNTRLLFNAAAVMFFASLASAQCETRYNNRWQIRSNVSATFTEGLVEIALNDSFPYMRESCPFMCHPLTGALQFGCSPSGIVDANGDLMPNGQDILGGTPIPKPSSSRFYYIFSFNGTDVDSGTVSYSVIDMELRGGLGDVTTEHNLELPGMYHLNPCIGIASPDGLTHRVYFWSATSGYLLNYRITFNEGLILEPDSQQVPMEVGFATWLWCTSISNDRMAWWHPNNQSGPGCMTARVDPESGLLSSLIFLPVPGFQNGMAFSSSGNKFYMTNWQSQNPDDPRLFQADLSSSDPDSVLASLTPLSSSESQYGNDPWLSTGNDGRVYMTFVSGSTSAYSNMTVIDSPEEVGGASDVLWYEMPIGIEPERIAYLRPNPIWPRLGALSASIDEPTLGPLPTLNVQPNPAHGQVTFLLEGEGAAPMELRLYDVLGKQVLQRSWPAGTNKQTIDVSALAPGHYEASVLMHGAQSIHTHLLVD